LRTVAIIPARTDSRRLPGKHLRLLSGRPLLEVLVDRVRGAPGVAEVVVATTDRPCDEALAELACRLGTWVYCGGLDDVLGRFTGAASAARADVAVKVNGDSPLIAPEVIATGLRQLAAGPLDFVTGKNACTGLPIGLGPGLIRMGALLRLDRAADTPAHREAITTYIFEHPKAFRWEAIPVEEGWRAPELSLTVDTPSDLERLDRIARQLGPGVPRSWKIEEIIAVGREEAASGGIRWRHTA
jgi:spore coat polysaccharide biosynthesis protein SpsF